VKQFISKRTISIRHRAMILWIIKNSLLIVNDAILAVMNIWMLQKIGIKSVIVIIFLSDTGSLPAQQAQVNVLSELDDVAS
jgi:hypothetical protein